MNRNLFFVAAALSLWGIGEGMFFNFVPIYLDNQFHLSEYQIGLVLGAFGLSMAITHIPAGRLADTLINVFAVIQGGEPIKRNSEVVLVSYDSVKRVYTVASVL